MSLESPQEHRSSVDIEDISNWRFVAQEIFKTL
jgi:hypothetical protein